MSIPPRGVIVLLATKDGAHLVGEQLAPIADQEAPIAVALGGA